MRRSDTDMKFMHIADVHLGAAPDSDMPFCADRGREIWNTFAAAVGEAEKENADLLLIPGDLFHRQPLVRELREVNYLFQTLTHTRVVLTAGNHDYLKADSAYFSFLWADNVTVLFDEEMACAAFPDINTEVYGFSYHSREITEERYRDVQPADNGRIHILLAHGGDARHIPVKTEELGRLAFDYIAFGHIHQPAVLIPGKAAYAGALEPIDRNDTGPHGYITGEIDDSRTVHFSFVPFASRSYFHETAEVGEETTEGALCDDMKRIMAEKGPQNLYQWTITGYRSPDTAFSAEMLSRCGNVLSVADQTEPALHIEDIQRSHTDDIVGRYIETFLPEGMSLAALEPDPLRRQALYEGVQALIRS